ncbi:MAG: hypothetical protein GTN64_08125 [Candidatus Latescibacteria bacterium]|nr:hypothetical protein [Candidatus Latescibacterota bacterium]NIO78569.1 hypothetical protein [Candidatus Latescibacterota bacterium]
MPKKKEEEERVVQQEGSDGVINAVPEEKEQKIDKTPVLVHMQRYHHHGHVGILRKHLVYRIWKHWADSIEKRFPGTLKLIDENDVPKIIETNKKRAEKLAEERRKEQKEAQRAIQRAPSNRMIRSSAAPDDD